MEAGLYSTVSGNLASQARLEAIANNLANASTVGFKQQRFVQVAASVNALGAATSPVSTPITEGTLRTDFSQGSVEHTGNALDVSLSGRGFLVIATDAGERLTRQGTLRLDGEGFLVTSDGLRVQGTGGDLQIPDGPVVFGPDGTIQAGESAVGQLRVVDVDVPEALSREGSTLFAPGEQAVFDVPPDSVRVQQGTLERANVSTVESLVGLIETVRGFEAYVNAAERIDEVATRAITEVGRV